MRTMFGDDPSRRVHPEETLLETLKLTLRDAAEEASRANKCPVTPQPGCLTEHELQLQNWLDATIRLATKYAEKRDERLAAEKKETANATL